MPLGNGKKKKAKREFSRVAEKEGVWKSIWRLRVPGVVKTFLWKAISNYLPTRKTLYERKISNNPLCPICEKEVETVSHTLWSCGATSDVWFNSIQKWSSTEEDLIVLWVKFIRYSPQEELEVVAITIRRVWLRRNNFIYEQSFVSRSQLVQAARINLEEF